MELMASHDFQTALQNYLDLEDLRKKLAPWQTSFDAFDDIIELRGAELRAAAARGRRASSASSTRRCACASSSASTSTSGCRRMLTAPRPDYLATADERIVPSASRARAKQLGETRAPRTRQLRQRIATPAGRAHLAAARPQYHERLTEAHTHLNELNADVAAMTRVPRVRPDPAGGDAQLRRLRRSDQPAARRVGEALQRVDLLMARQGHMLETVAINELKARRERLDGYQAQARYAVADSYDRAARRRMRRGPAGDATRMKPPDAPGGLADARSPTCAWPACCRARTSPRAARSPSCTT